jgi:hypothetical protein
MLAALGTALCGLPDEAFAVFPGDNGKIAYEHYENGTGTADDIYVVNPDGSGATQLTTDPAYDWNPAWSADGRKIAFERYYTSGHGEIWVMNANGSGQTRLTNNQGRDYDPAWTPDGRISFTSTRDGNAEIYVMDADGSGQTRITYNPAYDSAPAWSPDGTKIAFMSDRGANGARGIYTMNVDGSGVTQLTSPPNSSHWHELPDWSPDSKKIVFGVGGDCLCENDFYGVVVMNSDGTGQRTLRGDTGYFYYYGRPAWSPDGSQMLYDTGAGPAYLYVFPSDGGCCDSTVASSSAYGLVGMGDWQPLRPPGYARPRAATPTTVKLVPAYAACKSPNGSHGAPLASGSCGPPVQSSSYLTVGTTDANGHASNSTGVVKLKTICNPPAPNPVPLCSDPGEQADVGLTASISDVRKSGDLLAYLGELRVVLPLRITDRLNGPGGVHPGTATDTSFGFNLSCLPTSDPQAGSTCSAATTADSVMPGIALEDKRAVWQLGQIEVYDGGADGDADTAGDNTLFAVQGLFAP